MTPRPRIAVLGAGPIGLEAALAAAEHGFPFTVYEAAGDVAAHMRSWGHVRLFTPWDLDASPRMRCALREAGRAVPTGDACPTGADLTEAVFQPLARLPWMAPHVHLGTRVLAVGRRGLLKHEEIASTRRGAAPFRLLLSDARGVERIAEADVVLDCTGTFGHPNALGDGGTPAPGEAALASFIHRTIPAFEREPLAWLGKTVLLAGSGHSAQTAAVHLAALAARHEAHRTRVIWALRHSAPRGVPSGEDPLVERACLGREAARLIQGGSPVVESRTGVVVDRLARLGDGVEVTLRETQGNREETVVVDRVLSLTGYVGDHELYRQLQVHECYATSSPMKLAAALLGAGGDCLAQRPQGVEMLVNPEPGFFILGSKSYGRNNTFLMRAGWVQVDEVFEFLGDGFRANGGRNRCESVHGS